jgi:glycogen debranching enzyme
MISTTAKILAACTKKDKSLNMISEPPDTTDYLPSLLLKAGITDPKKVTDYVVPKIFDAIQYLADRDIDNDDLLEQGHNEDWMDTILRAGKIVYSQACWILALTNFSTLLGVLGKRSESRRMRQLAESAIKAVNDILWSDEDNCYIDIQEEHHLGDAYRTLMQDVSLYLIASSEYFNNDISQGNPLSSSRIRSQLSETIGIRSAKTLQTMKKRLWKNGWPLVTEVELKVTGPWKLKPYEYHNKTTWPWCTAMEIIARSKFNQIKECTALLAEMSSGKPYMFSFYEWINPLNRKPEGAFPFRTGISALRLAIVDILKPQIPKHPV